MKNTFVQSVFMLSMLLLFSCNKQEKATRSPAPPLAQSGNTAGTRNLTLTPGQIHNLVLEQYAAQYGFVEDNEITLPELQTLCQRISGIMEDQNLLVNVTAADLANRMVTAYVGANAFVNGILKSSDELTTSSLNAMPNSPLKSAYSQIHTLAVQGDPNFTSDAVQILDNLSGLSQLEQEAVIGYRSVLTSSATFWSNPSHLPTPGTDRLQRIINADAMGFNEGVNRGTSMGMNSYDASFNGTAESIARSAQARIGN